jgi:micrococcal nuclease
MTTALGVLTTSNPAWAWDIPNLISISGLRAPSQVKSCEPDTFAKYSNIRGKVSKVVDGDTIGILWQDNEYRIRMVGIDTPELHYLGKDQGPWAVAAQEHLAMLIPVGTSVTVSLKGEKCDHYGRILGEVFWSKQNINDLMLADAYAVNYCIFPDNGCDEKASLVWPNLRNQKGIFADENLELPYLWRVRVSGRTHVRYIGNIESHEVFPPGSFEHVDVPDRVFFNEKRDIRPPYYNAE